MEMVANSVQNNSCQFTRDNPKKKATGQTKIIMQLSGGQSGSTVHPWSFFQRENQPYQWGKTRDSEKEKEGEKERKEREREIGKKVGNGRRKERKERREKKKYWKKFCQEGINLNREDLSCAPPPRLLRPCAK